MKPIISVTFTIRCPKCNAELRDTAYLADVYEKVNARVVIEREDLIPWKFLEAQTRSGSCPHCSQDKSNDT